MIDHEDNVKEIGQLSTSLSGDILYTQQAKDENVRKIFRGKEKKRKRKEKEHVKEMVTMSSISQVYVYYKHRVM